MRARAVYDAGMKRTPRTRPFPGVLALLGPPAILAAIGLATPAVRSASAELVDRIAATVDEAAIPESELRKAMAVSAMSRTPAESEVAFRARVLDALIDQKLQYREALRFAPAPLEPSQVEAAMVRLRERIRQSGRDPDREFAAAGMTPEDVRAAIERQLVVQNYLAERFRPIAVADDERARQEYDKVYVPERQAAGAALEPFEKVGEEMRRRVQQRVFDEEAAKWMKEIRQKAAIAVYDPSRPLPAGGTPVPLAAPKPLPTAAASKAPGVGTSQ